MIVFIDTSFLFSLLNTDDEFHQSAIHILADLQQKDILFYSNSIVIAEMINLVFRTKGSATAKKVHEALWLLDITYHFVTEDLFNEAYALLFQQRTKNRANLFDCVHIATMKRLGIDTILTYDNDFKRAGMKTISI
jgi:predicted nucleic acid-binding protein